MTDFTLQSTVGMVKFFKCMQKDKFILNTYFDFKLSLDVTDLCLDTTVTTVECC